MSERVSLDANILVSFDKTIEGVRILRPAIYLKLRANEIVGVSDVEGVVSATEDVDERHPTTMPQ